MNDSTHQEQSAAEGAARQLGFSAGGSAEISCASEYGPFDLSIAEADNVVDVPERTVTVTITADEACDLVAALAEASPGVREFIHRRADEAAFWDEVVKPIKDKWGDGNDREHRIYCETVLGIVTTDTGHPLWLIAQSPFCEKPMLPADEAMRLAQEPSPLASMTRSCSPSLGAVSMTNRASSALAASTVTASRRWQASKAKQLFRQRDDPSGEKPASTGTFTPTRQTSGNAYGSSDARSSNRSETRTKQHRPHDRGGLHPCQAHPISTFVA